MKGGSSHRAAQRGGEEDSRFQLLLQLLVLLLQLGFGLDDGVQFSSQNFLLAGQVVHLSDQVVLHHVQSVSAGGRRRSPLSFLTSWMNLTAKGAGSDKEQHPPPTGKPDL